MLPDVPRRVGPVTGLGISRVDFDFKIFASSNVLVIRTSKEGVDKTLKEGEDYTVTWDEDQTANIGGYITLDEFLTDGESGWAVRFRQRQRHHTCWDRRRYGPAGCCTDWRFLLGR